MASKIEPRTNLHITDKDFPTGYRLYDDLKGISSGLTIERVKSIMERGGIRLKGASKGVRITDCHFTLKAPQTGSNLPGGVEIQAGVKDVLVEGCEAAHFCMVPVPKKYDNGDGFATERGCIGVLFRNCYSHDNSDGGFDTKGDYRLENCRAERNKRNYRAWDGGVYVNCTSRDPREAHWWFGTGMLDATLVNPTFEGTGHHLMIDYGKPGQVIAITGGSVDGRPITRVEDLRIKKNGKGKNVTVTWAPIAVAPRGFDAGEVLPDANKDGLVKIGAAWAKKLSLPVGSVLKNIGGTRYEVVS